MDTVTVDINHIDDAAMCLKEGGLVVFPTETVYGLGADSANPDAVARIYKAKGRPSDNPLIVHIAHAEDVKKFAREVPDYAKKLADRFWPGPMTLIFKKQPWVDSTVTAGLDTVAVRLPSNETARRLIELSGVFPAAPSANLSGSPSPTVYRHVADDLMGRVDFIINGDGCEIGLESTVVDVSGEFPVVLRPGAVTIEMLRVIEPRSVMNDKLVGGDDVPKCPGMKYTHYSPKANVVVVCGDKPDRERYIKNRLETDKNAGVLAFNGGDYADALCVIDAGTSMESYAKGLFYNLRLFDEAGADTVFAEFEEQGGIGVAVKNRLYKSAGYNIVRV